MKKFAYIAVAIVILFGIFAISGVVVCRDWAYVCELTGSQKGHREWRFGLQTRHWHKTSPYEEYLAKHRTVPIEHRWVSYAGTGKDIFGKSILYGHGRPGGLFRFDQNFLQEWLETCSQKEALELYDSLVAGEHMKVATKLEEIENQAMGIATENKNEIEQSGSVPDGTGQ